MHQKKKEKTKTEKRNKKSNNIWWKLYNIILIILPENTVQEQSKDDKDVLIHKKINACVRLWMHSPLSIQYEIQFLLQSMTSQKIDCNLQLESCKVILPN